jgi:hypothetical protein
VLIGSYTQNWFGCAEGFRPCQKQAAVCGGLQPWSRGCDADGAQSRYIIRFSLSDSNTVGAAVLQIAVESPRTPKDMHRIPTPVLSNIWKDLKLKEALHAWQSLVDLPIMSSLETPSARTTYYHLILQLRMAQPHRYLYLGSNFLLRSRYGIVPLGSNQILNYARSFYALLPRYFTCNSIQLQQSLAFELKYSC